MWIGYQKSTTVFDIFWIGIKLKGITILGTFIPGMLNSISYIGIKK